MEDSCVVHALEATQGQNDDFFSQHINQISQDGVALLEEALAAAQLPEKGGSYVWKIPASQSVIMLVLQSINSRHAAHACFHCCVGPGH